MYASCCLGVPPVGRTVERLASQAEDEQYRSLLIRVAARWSELADQQKPAKLLAKMLHESGRCLTAPIASSTIRRNWQSLRPTSLGLLARMRVGNTFSQRNWNFKQFLPSI